MIGWRVYGVTGDGLLTSLGVGPDFGPMAQVTYPSAECVAACDQGHTPPGRDCWCGVYLFDRPTAIHAASGRRYDTPCEVDYFTGPRVNATVATTGPVMLDRYWVHLGPQQLKRMAYRPYRAAKVTITELGVPGPGHCVYCESRDMPLVSDAVLGWLQARYRVPVTRLAPHMGRVAGVRAEDAPGRDFLLNAVLGRG